MPPVNAPPDINAEAQDDAASPTQTATPPAPPSPPATTPQSTARADTQPSYAASAYARSEPPAQIAGVVATLARNGEGEHRLTLRLDPIELGRIEVVIDRQRGLPATVTLTVERPETLLRLVRDQDQLARALDQVGLATADHKLHFQLASHDSTPASQTEGPRPDPRQPLSADQAPGPNQDPAMSLPSRQDASSDGRTPNHRGQHQAGGARPGSARSETVATPLPIADAAPHTLHLRGIDITA